MKAIDTNILVRFLAADDPRQAALATECVRDGVLVTDTVLMETEWVLRSGYGWTRERINHALSTFVTIQHVEVERFRELQWALDRHRRGADWADMLHLIASRGQTSFSTFDQRLAKLAGENAPLPVQLLR